MIYVLAISLLIIFIISFILNKKDIVSPSFIFSFGFVFQSIWAVVYAKKWDLDLHINTFLVIVLGVLEFAIVSYLTKLIIKKVKSKNKKDITEKKTTNSYQISEIVINKRLEIVFLIFTIGISVVYLYFILKSVGGNMNSFSSISAGIAKYDSLSKFTDEFDTVKLPFIVTNLELVVIASGYWFLYVIINNFLYNNKIKITEVFIVIIAFVSSMLSGSRGTIFMIIVSAISFFIVLLSKKKEYKNVLDIKLIRNISIIGIVFLATFYSLANVLGRNVNDNKLNYLAVYCGAEVKNLDIYLQETHEKKTNIFGAQTFVNVVATLGEKIGFEGYERYRLDLPFRQVGTYSLGNVYTTFYPFIYDFGYFGEFVLVFIMAVISQLIYEYAKSAKAKKYPNISILIYGNIFCCLILSFFSNKFYENIFSMGMIKNILFWIIFNYIFCVFDYKKLIKDKRRNANENRCSNCNI